MKHSCAILSLMAMVLAGCDSAPESDAAATAVPSQQVAKVAKVDDPTARMARAVGAGKPGASVDLKYDFLSRPAVGKAVEVELALIPNAGVNSLDITVSGMEGVTLAGPLTASFTDVKAGQPYRHRFSMLADRTGVFYLTVAAITHIGGASMGKTFSVPFVIGTPAPKQKPAPPPKDASGQPIQAMPAQESTR